MAKQAQGGSLIEIVDNGGVASLRCPLTGLPVWTEEGFEEAAERSPYLRFFVDWAGEVWMPRPPVGEVWGGYMGELLRIWLDPAGGNQNQRVARCVAALPRSGVVFEVLDPPCGPKPGFICYACFVLAPIDPVLAEANGVEGPGPMVLIEELGACL